jgi:hypothetical protein
MMASECLLYIPSTSSQRSFLSFAITSLPRSTSDQSSFKLWRGSFLFVLSNGDRIPLGTSLSGRLIVEDTS